MTSETSASPRPGQVLSSWKDIANYLRRDVRTVQRWEQSRGLPIHRLPGNGKHAVYALQSEIDHWWANTPEQRERLEVVALPAQRRSKRLYVVGAIVAAVTALAVSVWMLFKPATTPPPLRPEYLTSLPAVEMYPTLSPDGQRLVFTARTASETQYDLHLMSLPAGLSEPLTSSPGLHFFPEWSPDGTRLAYARIIVGARKLEVRLIDLKTKEDTLLVVEPLGAVAPPAWVMAWSRRSDALFLTTPGPDDQRAGISLHEIASGKRTNVTMPDSSGFWDLLPAVSPDESSLVFLRRKLTGNGNLFRQDLKPDGSPSGTARQITHEECCVDSPSWSPDGTEVIFLSKQGGTPRLMRVSAAGGAARHDTTIASPGAAPRVTANGWLLSWDLETSNRLLEVPLRKGVAAGPPHELIVSSRRDGSPAFSPDGKQIVFRSNRSGTWQLWMYSRNDAAARQFTQLEDLEPFYPDWSPRAKFIAFEGHGGKQTGVYLADAATGKHWPITADGLTARLPRWSRNGSSIYIASDRTGRYETWRIDLDTNGQVKRTTQVTAQGGYSGVESPDGRFIYYSKQATLESIWRVPLGGGNEEEVLKGFPFNRYPTNLAAGPDGLYFRGQGGERGEQGQPVWMLPFSGGPPRKVMVEPGVPSPGGIAVSPDGKALLLSGLTYRGGDVFVYKSFR